MNVFVMRAATPILFLVAALSACETPRHPSVMLGAPSLSWSDNSGGVAVTLIERRAFAESVWTQIAATPAGATEYVDASALASERVCYRIRAVIDEAMSDSSNEACTAEGKSR